MDSGHTALHIASKLGSKDVAKILLQHKASVMVKDVNGCTPLYLAASSGNYEIAKLIIACPGCDMNVLSQVILLPCIGVASVAIKGHMVQTKLF